MIHKTSKAFYAKTQLGSRSVSLQVFSEVIGLYHKRDFASIPLLIQIRRFLDAISLKNFMFSIKIAKIESAEGLR